MLHDSDQTLCAEARDEFFQSRFLAVINALRQLGWDGEQFGDLSKNGHTLKMHFKQVGAGKNIIGMHYTIGGVDGFFMSDTLSLDPEDLAKRIDLGLPSVEPGVVDPDPIVLTGTELGEFEDTQAGLKALRDAARQFLADMRGEMVDCPVIGEQVEIRKRGIKETLAFSGNPKKLKLIPAIRSLIRGAMSARWEDNAKSEKNLDVLGYYLLRSSATLEREELKVEVLIEKDKQGHLYYDLLVDRQKTNAALDDSRPRPYPNIRPTTIRGIWML